MSVPAVCMIKELQHLRYRLCYVENIHNLCFISEVIQNVHMKIKCINLA